MKFLTKILLYIKGLFVPQNKYSCRLDEAYWEADNALSQCKSFRYVAVSTMARRHMLNVKKNISRMRNTADPDVFNSSFESVLLLCDRIKNMELSHKSLIAGAEKITELLTKKYETHPLDAILVYYGVTFGKHSREYYYLSDDMPCEEGQYVLVPTGESMENRVAKIESVYHFTPTNAPYPADKLKTIIKILV